MPATASWCWKSARFRLPVVSHWKYSRAGKFSARRPSLWERRISASVRLKRISVALTQKEDSDSHHKNKDNIMMCNRVTTQSGGTSAWPPASCRGVCKMAGMWSTRSSSDRLGRHTRRSLRGASAESFSWCSDVDEEPGSNQKASRNEPENKRRGNLSISEELMLPTWLFALITT